MHRRARYMKIFWHVDTTVGFGGGSDCANMGSGVATTVVGGWKVSLALSISQFFSPAASDAAMHLDRVSINYLLSR